MHILRTSSEVEGISSCDNSLTLFAAVSIPWANSMAIVRVGVFSASNLCWIFPLLIPQSCSMLSSVVSKLQNPANITMQLTDKCHCVSLFHEATMKPGVLDQLQQGRIVLSFERGHQLIVTLVSWLIR